MTDPLLEMLETPTKRVTEIVEVIRREKGIDPSWNYYDKMKTNYFPDLD